MPPFRKVDYNVDSNAQLRGKTVYFALYAESMMSEAKLLVNSDLAKIIDCGKPLEDLLASFRQAILNSARAHGNPTAQRN